VTTAAFSCRSCRAPDLRPVLSLGRMPLANALLTSDELGQPEETYPLDLVFCPGCSLAQITETVPPEKLFREYLYFSSFSETLLRHAEALAVRVAAERRLDQGSLVVELASNDGYLLQHYQRRQVSVLGVEPAVNVAAVARERGIRTVAEFFDEALARDLRARHGGADVIHAHNVLAHVSDLNGFVAGIARLLRDDGIAVIEVPYVKDLVDRCEFDTIYHEHLCYFSLTSAERLLRRHGLVVWEVESLPVHGGSLRLWVGPQASTTPGASVRAMLEQEAAGGVDGPAFYAGFGARVESVRAALASLLAGLVSQGRRLAAYGAAAKATVLLNYLRPERGAIGFVADRSPHKQGRFVPGIRLPIRPPAALLEEQPDYVLVLAWNLAEEIVAQQAEYRRRGGRFIVPIPEPRVL
jgi:SAM-dependent methyltransferase